MRSVPKTADIERWVLILEAELRQRVLPGVDQAAVLAPNHRRNAREKALVSE